MGNVIISTANVPQGTCPAWIISLWPQLVDLLSAELSGANNLFNFGNSVPAPADQDKPWIRINADGSPDKDYVFWNGLWVSPHALQPGTIMLWEGDITAINSFDGGESATVGPATGPMWERVDQMKGRFPLGAGPMVTSGTEIAVTATGGEETHKLTVSEIPPHTHTVNATPDDAGGNTGSRLRKTTDPDNATEVTGESGGGEAHNNIPPYYAIHFIRRTARLFYRV